jgi:hypothetical protein
MITIHSDTQEIMIRFPKNFVSPVYLNRFIERLELESLAQKNQMTEQQAWTLSEEIKQNWWEQNELEIMERIKNK